MHPKGRGTGFRIRIDGYEIGKMALALQHLDGWMDGRDIMIDEKGEYITLILSLDHVLLVILAS
jgi:hypothetical protein